MADIFVDAPPPQQQDTFVDSPIPVVAKKPSIVDYLKGGMQKSQAVGDVTPIKQGAGGLGQGVVNTLVGGANFLGSAVNAPKIATPDVSRLVGADSNSKLYKQGTTLGEVATSAAPVEELLGASKLATKGIETAVQGAKNFNNIRKEGKVLNLIREGQDAKSAGQALQAGKLEEPRTGITKFLLGSKEVVNPSARSERAAKTVVNVIDNVSTKPIKLYNQLTSKINEIGGALGNRLSEIKVGSMTKKASEIKTTLGRLAEQVGVDSPPVAKDIQKTATKIANSKTADDVWTAAKELDKHISAKIRQGLDLSDKEQYVYDAWRGARKAINNHLDEIATNIQDEGVKKAFETMTDLYHAEGQIQKNLKQFIKPVEGLLSKGNLKKAAIGTASFFGGKYILDKITK